LPVQAEEHLPVGRTTAEEKAEEHLPVGRTPAEEEYAHYTCERRHFTISRKN